MLFLCTRVKFFTYLWLHTKEKLIKWGSVSSLQKETHKFDRMIWRLFPDQKQSVVTSYAKHIIFNQLRNIWMFYRWQLISHIFRLVYRTLHWYLPSFSLIKGPDFSSSWSRNDNKKIEDPLLVNNGYFPYLTLITACYSKSIEYNVGCSDDCISYLTTKRK